MKMQFHHGIHLFLASAVLALRDMSAHVSAQPPPHARGQLKKFETSPDGDADIELYEGGPSIQCKMRNGRGRGNPRTCQSGYTSVTVVDAECGELLPWKSKKCFAASIVEGETGKIYTVNSRGDILERDSSDYPDEEHAPTEDNPPEEHSDRRSLRGGAGRTSAAAEVERSLAETPVIDVLVVYTQGAKANAQNYGDGPIENLINLAIAETNNAYANSGINAELRLAAMHEDTSGYNADVGSASMSASLYHLKYSAGNSKDPDGQLDYVHQMRTNVGADMVALITTGAGCGIAFLSGNCSTCNPSKGSMFSVTKYSCATGNYSFGHELGHNMGCNHDKGTSDVCGSTDYRYGFRAPDGMYRSVLSYGCHTSQCDANPGGPCARSPFFSNPDPAFKWNGGPMGATAQDALGETNNARRINERAEYISNFYPSVTPSPPTTASPTDQPSKQPTNLPTAKPIVTPTNVPTAKPTLSPSASPTAASTNLPTTSPTTNAPTNPIPSESPSAAPTNEPIASPTPPPSNQPTTGAPSKSPTDTPTNLPTAMPTLRPTNRPTTGMPTKLQTDVPTDGPTTKPTDVLTSKPTLQPTSKPTTACIVRRASCGIQGLNTRNCCNNHCCNNNGCWTSGAKSGQCK